MSQRGTKFKTLEGDDEAPLGEEARVQANPLDMEINEPVVMKENMHLGPFQKEIIEGKTKPLLGEGAHVMVTPLRVGEAQPRGGGLSCQACISSMHTPS